MTEFELDDNEWLQEIYDIRERWIPAYLLDEPLAGLMRTSSRSESENHFFSKFTSRYLTLVEFLTHYDTAMEHQRYVQELNDHNTRYTVPDFKTNLALEKHAVVMYTRSIFFDVQDDIVASYTNCLSESRESIEDSEIFRIKDTNTTRVYEVKYNALEVTAVCSCNKFALYGLLCRHIFYVFSYHNLEEIPKKYVLKRWSAEAMPEKIDKVVDKPEIRDSTVAGIRAIQQIVEQTANRLVHNADKFAKYQERLMQLLEEAKAEFPTPIEMDKGEAICSFFGVKKPVEHNIKNPDDVRTKGRKRAQSKGDVAMDKAKRRANQCGKCKEYGHNSRGCKNSPMIESTPTANATDEAQQATAS